MKDTQNQITACCFGILHAVNGINTVITEKKFAAPHMPAVKEALIGNRAFLDETAQKLRLILEDVCDYMDGQCMSELPEDRILNRILKEVKLKGKPGVTKLTAVYKDNSEATIEIPGLTDNTKETPKEKSKSGKKASGPKEE